MRFGHVITTALSLLSSCASTTSQAFQSTLLAYTNDDDAISAQLFAELEELARIVDIAYCVGGLTGIQKPFKCLGRCDEFPSFELVTTWNTGPLLSDSCGYIALDHSPTNPRVILAFRGTYSLANTVADLSTIPQEYTPYPGDDSPSSIISSPQSNKTACASCTVHSGFLRSWRNTRTTVLPPLTTALLAHPTYTLHLVGHSLGGAVALLASLDLLARNHTPIVTTFGEPRAGNAAFVAHVDAHFDGTITADATNPAAGAAGRVKAATYRRVTHIDDPVPLLPLTEWGYRPHAGELFIAKAALPPALSDVRICEGDADAGCSAGGDSTLAPAPEVAGLVKQQAVIGGLEQSRRTTMTTRKTDGGLEEGMQEVAAEGLVPARYKLWQLFFAHRDYFWRLGVCVKIGDPWHWTGGEMESQAP